MSKKLDQKIIDVLEKYGFGPESCWDCRGTWVVYHSVCEQLAALSGIKYDAPQILVSERDAAVILVTGRLEDACEWSIGEATIGLNYSDNKKNGAKYPFAMAEKRAKDRVILKLLGLHGLLFSEEENDDFKKSDQKNGMTDKEIEVANLLKSGINAVNNVKTLEELENLSGSNDAKFLIKNASDEQVREFTLAIDKAEERLSKESSLPDLETEKKEIFNLIRSSSNASDLEELASSARFQSMRSRLSDDGKKSLDDIIGDKHAKLTECPF